MRRLPFGGTPRVSDRLDDAPDRECECCGRRSGNVKRTAPMGRWLCWYCRDAYNKGMQDVELLRRAK